MLNNIIKLFRLVGFTLLAAANIAACEDSKQG